MQQPNAETTKPYKYLVKVVVVGDYGVGKSQLISMWTNKNARFIEDHEFTIGVEFATHFIEIDEERVKLQIWDTAGHPDFQGLSNAYYRGATLFIFAWNPEQLNQLGGSDRAVAMLNEMVSQRGKDVPVILARTKWDKDDPEKAGDIASTESRLKALVERKGFVNAFTVTTSAKMREGFDLLEEGIKTFFKKNKTLVEYRVAVQPPQYGLSEHSAKAPKTWANPFVECLRSEEVMLVPEAEMTNLFHQLGSNEHYTVREIPLEERVARVKGCGTIGYEKGDRLFRAGELKKILLTLTEANIEKEMIWFLLNLLSIGQRKVGKFSRSSLSRALEIYLDAFFQYTINHYQRSLEYYVLRAINPQDFCASQLPVLNIPKALGNATSASMCAVLHLLRLLDREERGNQRVFNRDLIEPTKKALYEIARVVFNTPAITKENIPALLKRDELLPDVRTEIDEILNQYLPNKPVVEARPRISFGNSNEN